MKSTLTLRPPFVDAFAMAQRVVDHAAGYAFAGHGLDEIGDLVVGTAEPGRKHLYDLERELAVGDDHGLEGRAVHRQDPRELDRLRRGRTGTIVEEGHLPEEIVGRIHGLEHSLAALDPLFEVDRTLERGHT